MSAERDEIIRQWMTAKQNADGWAKQERALRDYIAKQAFGFDIITHSAHNDGTKRIDLGNGYKLKAVLGTSWKLQEGPALDQAVTVLRGMNNGYMVLDSVTDLKRVLHKAGYLAAAPDIQKVLAPAIKTTPVAPQLSVEGLE